jgi:hypothetical protein
MLQCLTTFLMVWRVFSGRSLLLYLSEPYEGDCSKTDACQYEGYLGLTVMVDSYAFLDFLNRPFFWLLLCSTNSHIFSCLLLEARHLFHDLVSLAF